MKAKAPENCFDLAAKSSKAFKRWKAAEEGFWEKQSFTKHVSSSKPWDVAKSEAKARLEKLQKAYEKLNASYIKRGC